MRSVFSAAIDRLLVGGKIHQNARLQVVADDRDIVVLLHLIGKCIGCPQRVIQKLPAADLEGRSGGELHQQHCRISCLGEAKGLDGLNNIVLQHPELLLLQSRNKLAIFAQNQCVHRDQRNIDIDRVTRHALGRLRRGRRSRSGRLLVRIHLRDRVRSAIVLRTAGLGRRRLLLAVRLGAGVLPG